LELLGVWNLNLALGREFFVKKIENYCGKETAQPKTPKKNYLRPTEALFYRQCKLSGLITRQAPGIFMLQCLKDEFLGVKIITYRCVRHLHISRTFTDQNREFSNHI
jgi:hypothetical protein